MPLLAPIKDKRDLPLELDYPTLNYESEQDPEFVHIALGKRYQKLIFYTFIVIKF